MEDKNTCEKKLFNILKMRLGEIDAINEYTEVLLRYSADAINGESYFQSVAAKYGIRVNDVPFTIVADRVRRSYFIAVQTEVEKFANAYLEKCKMYGKSYTPKQDRESSLKAAYKQNISMGVKITDAWLLYLICDYYRLVRNNTAHNLDTELNDKYSELNERRADIKKMFPELSAPNDDANIQFDDFLLFSRALKMLATELLNKFIHDEDKLLELNRDKIKKYINNLERQKRVLTCELVERYDVNKEDAPVLVDSIINKMK